MEEQKTAEYFMSVPVGFKFRLIHEEFSRRMTADLQQYHVTYPQMCVLRYLGLNQDHRITQKELCTALEVKHPTMVGILRRMEGKDLIRQCVDQDNRRCRNIFLADAGRTILEKQAEERHERDRMLISGFSEEERETLDSLLLRVYESLRRDTAGGAAGKEYGGER